MDSTAKLLAKQAAALDGRFGPDLQRMPLADDELTTLARTLEAPSPNAFLRMSAFPSGRRTGGCKTSARGSDARQRQNRRVLSWPSPPEPADSAAVGAPGFEPEALSGD
jgi:hypothetical protein